MENDDAMASLSFLNAPRMVTKVPGPKSQKIVERVKALETTSVIMPYVLPMAMDDAKGATIKDADGNVIIDLMAGTGVMGVGHCNPHVNKAIVMQSEKLNHAVDAAHSSKATLLEELVSIVPGSLRENSRIMFGTNGAEVVENALKISRWKNNRHGIIAFDGSFHGRTMGALSLTGRVSTHKGLPLVPGVNRMPYPYCYRCPLGLQYPDCDIACADYVDNMLSNPEGGLFDIGALIIEPVQGSSKVVPPEGYMEKLMKICVEHDLILIADEIQCGLGRTGKMFAVEHWNVSPDIMTIGKAMANGFPMSATIARKEYFTDLVPGQHTSTYGGNPMGCAAASATLNFMKENNIVDRAAELGEYFIRSLQDLAKDYSEIGEVRGKGLMIGIELVSSRETKEPVKWNEFMAPLIRAMLDRGVLVLPGGSRRNVIRLLPPLVITKDQIDRSVDVIRESLKIVRAAS